MQPQLTDKLSLYDLLGFFIPGFIIAAVAFILPSPLELYNFMVDYRPSMPDWCEASIFIMLSYVIGFINADITDKFWSPFRNNKDEIKYWKEAVKNRATRVRPCYCYLCRILFRYLIITILIYSSLNYPYLWWVLFVLAIVYFFHSLRREPYRLDKEVEEYYRKYYFVESQRSDNSIKIIESQVALLKNLCLPCCVWFVALCTIKNYDFMPCIMIIWFAALLCLAGAAVKRQNTIYRIIHEDYKYLTDNK